MEKVKLESSCMKDQRVYSEWILDNQLSFLGQLPYFTFFLDVE